MSGADLAGEVEDLQPLVGAVGDPDAGALVDGDAVGDVELAWPVTRASSSGAPPSFRRESLCKGVSNTKQSGPQENDSLAGENSPWVAGPPMPPQDASTSNVFASSSTARLFGPPSPSTCR